jgi:hypothetical protein
VSSKRVVLVATLLAVLVLAVVFAFTWGGAADRIATAVSALAAIASLGAIFVGPAAGTQRGKPTEERAEGAAYTRQWASPQTSGPLVQRERSGTSPRFVAAVFWVALVASSALSAAALFWEPLANIHNYRTAWNNLGALALAAVAVAGYTRPPTQRLALAVLPVAAACYLILENDRLRSGPINPTAWALSTITTIGWLPFALVFLLTLAWLLLREAPPVSLWVAVLAPAALFMTANLARSVSVGVEIFAPESRNYGLTFTHVLLNSAGLASAVAVASWVSFRLYRRSD